MTPCEKLGYKVGDRFVVREGYQTNYYKEEDVFVFTDDDGTDIPGFMNETTKEEDIYISLYKLEKIEDAWNGEGLPPVGTVCIYEGFGTDYKGIVACHVIYKDGKVSAVFQIDGGGWAVVANSELFSPIKPKKTEAELMEEIFNKSGIQGLIDAGYHK